jgi:hypothetical protein
MSNLTTKLRNYVIKDTGIIVCSDYCLIFSSFM